MANPEFREPEPDDLIDQEKLVRLYMMRYHQEDLGFVPLTKEENEQLDHFLKTAAEEDIKDVEKLSDKETKYFLYTKKDLPEKDRTKVEKEMEEDEDLRDYIERNLAQMLTEQYSIWRRESELGGKINSEMSEADIQKFFELIKRYPDAVDESLGSMSSRIIPASGNGIEIVPDEIAFLTERQKLIELRDYITGDLSPKKRDQFTNDLIDDKRFRRMFLKIKEALAKK